VSVRIYSFAKELGIDNKDLLMICEKAGIKGKGSALASLDEVEIAKIRQHMEGAKAKPAPARPATASSAAAAEAPAQPVAPVRQDAVAPRAGGMIRDLGRKPAVKPAANVPERSEQNTESPAREAPRKPAINIKLAAMPEVQQPVAPAKPVEKVQKPDIALPQEAIRDAMRRKSAAVAKSPLQDHMGKRPGQPSAPRPGGGTRPGGGAAGPSRNPLVDLAEIAAKAAGGPLSGRRKGKKTKEEEDRDAFESGLGSTRQTRGTRRKSDSGPESDDRPSRRRVARRRSGQSINTAAPRKENVQLFLPCSVREFSEAAGVPAVKVLLTLQKMGDESARTINSAVADEMVELLIAEFGLDHLDVVQAESLEDKMIESLEADDTPESLVSRPPVVTFLGHVDHGKTSLLDYLIGIDVVSGEAGGITQHIRAYQIEKDGRRISFVDTPGHEAFTEMRARGANVTDIAVLVIAADDGIMPQTDEAISHARAAGVPIIVALNKIDLPGANPEKVLQELAARELLPSEWGGEVEVIRTSAINGQGMDALLETILLTAELHEYRANPDRAAYGTCLEAEQQSDRGVIAKLIVQNGTLRVGDIVVCGAAHGRIKAMYDTLDHNRMLESAGPSVPVNVTGLDVAPGAGDRFYVLDDIGVAREIAQSREFESRQQALSGVTNRVSLQEFQQRRESGTLGKVDEVVTLNLIIRADVRGSIEALQKELTKLDHPEVRINILQALVGGVTIADVRLAQASEAVIIGFNVVPDETARSLAESLQVEIRRYDIIYKVTEDIRATLEGRLKPEEQTVELGMAMVLRVFNISRVGTIAGCRVMRGNIERGGRIRVIRENRVIGDYPIDSLKREKDDAREVQRGMECGIKLAGFNDIKEGDTLEAYRIEEVARTL
jgi:translation initiation factor IF-2